MQGRGPILFFDSGVGGLSVVAAARRLLPRAPFVYAADTAGFPYGTRDEAEIAGRVPALLGRLVERYRPMIVVIACNTASTIALSAVRAALDVAVVGTVPAIRPAAALSVTRTIGVLGTRATVRQAYVDDLAQRFAGDCTILRHGSADLVDMAEAHLRGQPASPDCYARVLDRLTGQPGGERIDVIVNACTHFPLVVDRLVAAAPPHVRFVDGSNGIARRIVHLIGDTHLPGRTERDRVVFTRLTDSHLALAPAFAAQGFGDIALL